MVIKRTFAVIVCILLMFYAVASDSPWWMPNGGTSFGKINGVSQFYGEDIMGGPGQPKLGGATGNMNGHKVIDNDEFIKQAER